MESMGAGRGLAAQPGDPTGDRRVLGVARGGAGTMKGKQIGMVVAIVALVVIGFWLLSPRSQPQSSTAPAAPSASGLPADAMAIARDRTLSPNDVAAALATYLPTGRRSEEHTSE